ncbi:MAG: T9SS type A sorting domain-containing protein [Bacteroidota bacterium]
MKRKDFLRSIGLAGAASFVPFKTVFAELGDTDKLSAACVLIPTETAGPFPLDLTANTTFFRSDIRESKTGVRLNVKIKVLGEDNCGVMQNVRVNIWHCDKDGLYSGYDTTNNLGQAGLTYLRGYQMTDVNGDVNFITIFPGWYNGRICHIHFQVYVSSSNSAISQMTFDLETKNDIYAANSSLYTKGADPMSLASDNIFMDGYSYQMATLTPNTATGGYDAYIEVTVKGNGLGIGHVEKENARQFSLGQNFPNPYSQMTSIPFNLNQSSDIKMEIWDLTGRKLATISDQQMSSGSHSIDFWPEQHNILPGNYVYQLEVKNADGIFRDTKMMSASV